MCVPLVCRLPSSRPDGISEAPVVEKFRSFVDQGDGIVENASGRPLKKDLEAKEVMNVR
jgi:hypothetical protein